MSTVAPNVPAMTEPRRRLPPGYQEQLDLGYVFGSVTTFAQRPLLTEPEQLDEWRPDVAVVGAPFDVVDHQPARAPGSGPRRSGAGVHARHLPPRPRAGDLRSSRSGRPRGRLLPARTDRGLSRQHPRPGPRRRPAGHRPGRPRRRPLDHLAGGDRRCRRAWPRRRRCRPLRRPRRHRRQHRREPGQPRHPDAAAHRIRRGAGQPLRPGGAARLLAAPRGLRVDARPGDAVAHRCRRSGSGASAR